MNGKVYALKAGTLLLIEHGDRDEIRATGRRALRTLNIYVPPGHAWIPPSRIEDHASLCSRRRQCEVQCIQAAYHICRRVVEATPIR